MFWFGTQSASSSSSPTSPSSPEAAAVQRVVIDEPAAPAPAPATFTDDDDEEAQVSSSAFAEPPVVIADEVLAAPVNRNDRSATITAATATAAAAAAGAGDDVILETTPLVVPAVLDAAVDRDDYNGESNSDHDIDSTAPVFRDVPFAVLFAIQIAIIAWLGVCIAPQGYADMKHGFDAMDWNDWKTKIHQDADNGITEEDIHMMESFFGQAVTYLQVYPSRIFMLLILPCCVLAFLFGWIVTGLVMTPCPKTMIYTSLVGSVLSTSIVLLVMALAAKNAVVWILVLVVVVGLAHVVKVYYWPRVPFCAANLRVATIGIGRNCGTYIVAFLFAVLGFCWVLVWVYVLVGTFAFQSQKCREAHPEANFDMMNSDNFDDVCDPPFVVILLFLLSLFWTNTVIMNTIQVTVAGVMATWCFDKSHANKCCSWAIFGSLVRSLTFSFGSICLGSLVQGVVFIFRWIVESAQRQRELQQTQGDGGGCCGGLCLCLLECLASLLEQVVECFNQLAFVYCGIYGYGYIDSGRRVMELMRARGWTVALNDQLSTFILHATTIVVGIITGLAGIVVEHCITSYYEEQPQQLYRAQGEKHPLHHELYNENDADGSDSYASYVFGPLPGAGWWSFWIAFIIGLWVASIMASVLRGAVNTMIVCWADSPLAFEMQHPHLTQDLARAWTEVFPSANVRPAYNPVLV